MNLILNFPKDKTIVEDGVALFTAILISRNIDNLDIENTEKQNVKEEIMKKLKELE